MLEAMQERQVTIGGTTYRMPQDIFIVIATQNPIEQEGTYPLSEAQTDRFMIKEKITYPSAQEEIEILNRIEDGSIARIEPAVLTLSDIDRVQDIAEKVYVDPMVKKYLGVTLLPQAGVALGMCVTAAKLGSADGVLIKNIILFRLKFNNI